MKRQEIIDLLIPVMEEVFDESGLAYSDSLTADDVREWTSLSHIRFMIAVEREFDIRFTAAEIEQLNNLGELVDAILEKKAKMG